MLAKPDILALFAETLPADVQPVLADQTCFVCAYSTPTPINVSLCIWERLAGRERDGREKGFRGGCTMIVRLCRSPADGSTRRIRGTFSPTFVSSTLDSRLSRDGFGFGLFEECGT